jgi:2-phospho-L-lactate guanylyltransferase
VPINSLAAAKSRLADALTAEERRGLVHWMAARVVEAIYGSGSVETIAVISPDDEMLTWAEELDAVALHQSAGGLNDGLEQGRAWARRRHFDALLILLGDLPYLTARDVRELVWLARPGGDGERVALAPDRRGRGTNGMFLAAGLQLPFAFGVESLARHEALSRGLGIEPVLYTSRGSSFDVDTPADLDELIASGDWTPCYAREPAQRAPQGKIAI